MIFISYRRADSEDVTGRIRERLSEAFGPDTIFMDVHDTTLGLDYRVEIGRKLALCKVLLAIIGDRWLTVADAENRPRLNATDDPVRIEIESALRRDVPVIPLLVRHAGMPRPESLPDPLRPLAYRTATSIRPDPDFDRDMERLVASLGRHLGVRPRNAPEARLSGIRSRDAVRRLTVAIVLWVLIQIPLFWASEAEDVRIVGVLVLNALGCALAILGGKRRRPMEIALGVLGVAGPWLLRLVAEPQIAVAAVAICVSGLGLVVLRNQPSEGLP